MQKVAFSKVPNWGIFLFAVRQFAHAQMFQDVYRARFLRHSGFPWPGWGGDGSGGGGIPVPTVMGLGLQIIEFFWQKISFNGPIFGVSTPGGGPALGHVGGGFHLPPGSRKDRKP